MTFWQKLVKNGNFWVYVLFRVSSLMGIVLLAVVLERGMFCEQFRYNIMIDRKTFEAVVDVHKVKGSEYINLYSI